MKNKSCLSEKTVVVVDGSPHEDGVTAVLTAALISALPPDVRVERFGCFARAPLPCIDCRACRLQPCCAFDDLNDYHKLLLCADAFVFASPVYNLSFPAPVKALIDRGQRYWSERFVLGTPAFAGPRRPAVLLTAAGSVRRAGDFTAGEMLERQLRPALTVINAALVRCVHYEGGDTGTPVTPFEEQARQAGLYLFDKGRDWGKL